MDEVDCSFWGDKNYGIDYGDSCSYLWTYRNCEPYGYVRKHSWRTEFQPSILNMGVPILRMSNKHRAIPSSWHWPGTWSRRGIYAMVREQGLYRQMANDQITHVPPSSQNTSEKSPHRISNEFFLGTKQNNDSYKWLSIVYGPIMSVQYTAVVFIAIF